MRYPVPDEAQEALLLANGINPVEFFVIHDDGDYLLIQNYKTGDEVTVLRNTSKKRGAIS